MIRIELLKSNNVHLQESNTLFKLTSWSRYSQNTFIKSIGLLRMINVLNLKEVVLNYLYSKKNIELDYSPIEDDFSRKVENRISLIYSKLQQSREKKKVLTEKFDVVLMNKIKLEEELVALQDKEVKQKETHTLFLKEIMELQVENNDLKNKIKEYEENRVTKVDSSVEKERNYALLQELRSKRKMLEDSKYRISSLSSKCDKLRMEIRKAKSTEKDFMFKSKKLQGKCGKRAYITDDNFSM